MGAGGACVCVCVWLWWWRGSATRLAQAHSRAHILSPLQPPTPPPPSLPCLRPPSPRPAPASFPPAALDLLEGLLTLNPEKRLTAEAALRMPFFTNPGAIPGEE